MAPQGEIPVAANVLGTIGTASGVYRIWTNYRTKKTDGLPALMMFLWAICAVPFGVYAIVQRFNIPIQIQPQIFGALSLISWAQILIYSNGWNPRKATLLAVAVAVLFGGIEAALILTLRPLYARGISFPLTIVGVVAAIFLAAGLIPPYFEIFRRRGRVLGINFLFLWIDWLGAFFSLMALVAQRTFDTLGGVVYIVCLLLEAGIFTSHGVWLLRTRKARKLAKQQGIEYDDDNRSRGNRATAGRTDPETGGDLFMTLPSDGPGLDPDIPRARLPSIEHLQPIELTEGIPVESGSLKSASSRGDPRRHSHRSSGGEASRPLPRQGRTVERVIGVYSTF